MKNWFGAIASLAVLFCTSSANAQSYSAASSYNWTGFYVGGTIGGIWAHDQISNPARGFLGEKASLDGVLGGPTIGYNIQVGSFLWGIEGDFSWTSADDKIDFGCAPTPCKEKLPYFGTARVRGGYVAGNSFLYLTGGAAFTRYEARQVSAQSFGGKDVAGWTIGAGWENSFAPNWSWKAEYLFADFGEPQTQGGGGIVHKHDLSEQIVRLGINYRFGSN